jgi:hypothetical protein
MPILRDSHGRFIRQRSYFSWLKIICIISIFIILISPWLFFLWNRHYLEKFYEKISNFYGDNFFCPAPLPKGKEDKVNKQDF